MFPYPTISCFNSMPAGIEYLTGDRPPHTAQARAAETAGDQATEKGKGGPRDGRQKNRHEAGTGQPGTFFVYLFIFFLFSLCGRGEEINGG